MTVDVDGLRQLLAAASAKMEADAHNDFVAVFETETETAEALVAVWNAAPELLNELERLRNVSHDKSYLIDGWKDRAMGAEAANRPYIQLQKDPVEGLRAERDAALARCAALEERLVDAAQDTEGHAREARKALTRCGLLETALRAVEQTLGEADRLNATNEEWARQAIAALTFTRRVLLFPPDERVQS